MAYYVTSDQLYDEWLSWKKTGQMSDTMAGYILRIAAGVAHSPRFR